MTTPKPPAPRRICQGGGGHPVKVSETTGLVKSHHYRGKHCEGSGHPPKAARNPRVCNLGNNCPHRRCCNAAHLEAVTSQENILRGAKTKLSEDRVITLYGRWLKGELKQDLAADCGVDPHTISRRFKKLEAAMSRMDAHDVQRPGQNLAWS